MSNELSVEHVEVLIASSEIYLSQLKNKFPSETKNEAIAHITNAISAARNSIKRKGTGDE